MNIKNIIKKIKILIHKLQDISAHISIYDGEMIKITNFQPSGAEVQHVNLIIMLDVASLGWDLLKNLMHQAKLNYYNYSIKAH